MDLLQMGKEKPIVVDTFMEPAYLREIVNPNRVVYMFAEDDLIRAEYLDRDHLRGMEGCSLVYQIHNVHGTKH